VNSKKLETSVEASFISIKRSWENNDEVRLVIPMSAHLEFLPDDSSKFAIMYGPLVMAAELGNSGMPSIYTNNHYYDPPPDSLLSNDAMPELEVVTSKLDWIVETEKPLHFKIKDKEKEYIIKPLYSIYDRKYHIFWQLK
jgi:DUF1680 family protein